MVRRTADHALLCVLLHAGPRCILALLLYCAPSKAQLAIKCGNVVFVEPCVRRTHSHIFFWQILSQPENTKNTP